MRFRIMLALAVAASTFGFPSAVAAEDEHFFPAGYEGYHDYDEVDAELDAAVAAFGQGSGAILKRYVIGQSYEGRDIWAVKISDKVASDENEPEALSECGMHAREHITVEMCLYMIDLLTQNYAASTALGQRVRRIVNTREIWIIPSLNPDGAEYNILGGEFHGWRKNRQLNPGSDKIGIDLNRNWSYMWNCCGGSGGDPGSARYRGRFPFEAVENQVLRDFILGRRVGDRQQISIVLNWHSYGEFVMWPYGFTKEDVPPQMTHDDHAAFVAMGRRMAALNGYRAKQGSDSYIYDGDFPAWAYGDQRMFVYTFEMYPSWGCDGCGGFKPPDTVIEREVTRNREAVLYFLEQADCPYRAAGLATTHCGKLYDDFETDRGWTFGGVATGGSWERGDPQQTSTGAGVKQLADTSTGLAALVTGTSAGDNANADDLDGTTTAQSPRFRLGSGHSIVAFRYSFAHDASATAADSLRLSIVGGTTTTPIWTVAANGSERNGAWQSVTLDLDAYAGQRIRLQFEASDGSADSLVEAAIDDVRVHRSP